MGGYLDDFAYKGKGAYRVKANGSVSLTVLNANNGPASHQRNHLKEES